MASSTTEDGIPAAPQTLGVTSNGEPLLLDLSFLTEEEREKLEGVLQADQELKTRDRIRLGTLRQDIQQRRTHQKGVVSVIPRKCTCCEARLGRFLNTGANCPQCGYRVCKRCRKVPYVRPPNFVCDICDRQRLLDLQSKDYVPSTTVTPVSSQKSSPVHERAAATQKEEEPPLYGSELVRKSLVAVGHRSRSSSPGSSPKYDPRPPLFSSSSVASSIVVRYEHRTSSESSSSSTPKDINLSSLARRVPANELLASDEEEESEKSQGSSEPAKTASVLTVEHLKRSDSMGSLGSMTSMYSAAGGKGDYNIIGEVFAGVWLRDHQLFVKVVKAKGLAAAKKGTSDPYVKTYLLPDRTKHTKRKTSIQRKTLNPVYNEILKNKLEQSEVGLRTLWLSVWDWDRFGRNQFLGEVRLPLSTLDLTDPTEHWYPLQDKDDGVNEDDFYRGKLRLSLKVDPSIDHRGHIRKGVASLLIRIHQAQELPKMNPLGLADATVKCYLLPNRSSGGKRKTKVIKNNLNPVWDEEFKYDFLTVNELSTERVLEVTVWDFDRRGSNDFIGGLRLGPAPGRATKPKEWMDSIGEEVTHWETALSRPGEWVEFSHTLRPTMHPLKKHGSPAGVRKSSLSPVKEMSPTHELEDQSVPVLVEGVAFTPPTSPQHQPPTPSHPPTPPHPHTFVDEQVVSPQQSPSQNKGTPTHKTPVTGDELKREGYYGSQTSLYSEAGGKGDYDITGEVLFGVQYKAGQLLVHVNKARGLAAADSNGYSDPYVKTYLLPDKSKTSKKKTAIKKKTLNPVYNETLKYEYQESEVEGRTLWLSVWDWDRFGRNQFLGEVRLPLSTLNLTDSTEHWYPLQDKSESPSGGAELHNLSPLPPDQKFETATPLKEPPQPPTQATPPPEAVVVPPTFPGPMPKPSEENPQLESHSTLRESEARTSEPVAANTPLIGDLRNSETSPHTQREGELSGLKRAEGAFGSQTSVYSAAGGKGDYDITGEVLFGVQYKAGQLLVHVNKARGLAAADSNRHSDPYVKTYLLPDKSKTSKKKTAIKKKTLNPVYNETLKYEFRESEIKDRTLLLSVWDWDRFGRNQFLGEVRLPLSTLNLADPTEHWYPLQDKGVSTSVGLDIHDQPPISAMPPPEQKFVTVAPQKETPTPHTEQAPNPASHSLDPLTPIEPILQQTEESPPPEVKETHPSLDTLRESEAVASEPVTHSSPLINIGDLRGSGEHLEEVSPHTQRGGHLGLKSYDSVSSFGSQASVYSAAGGKGDYDITGEVLFGVQYKAGQLLVHVNKARGLAAADSNGYSDPYVKTYLLPDKSKTSKKKTAIKKKTLNPVYNETLKYKLGSADIESHTLWLSVWDWDRFGRNQFLGEVRLPLSTLNLTDSTEHWYPLQDKSEETGPSHSGSLTLGLKFEPHSSTKKGTLHVSVKQATDLPAKDPSSPPNAFVKSLLLSSSKVTHSRHKTHTISGSVIPVWNEDFSYENVTVEELSRERVLEISVWDRTKNDKSFFGGLRLGPAPSRVAKPKEWMDSIGEEVTHWETALSRPGEWVELCHTLRTSMDYRHLDLSTPPPPLGHSGVTMEMSTPTKDEPQPTHSSSSADVESESTQPSPVVPSPGPTTTSHTTPSVSVEKDPPAPSLAISNPPKQLVLTPRPTEPITHSTPLIDIKDIGDSSHKEQLEDEPEESLPRPKAVASLQRGGHLGLKSADSVSSFGSQASVYSAAGGKGDYDITGEVLFGVQYKAGQLLVHVNKARGLAAADSNGHSDPYVKTYLLPDKSKTSKKKTAIKKKTLNPVYNETLKYKLGSADIETRTLWLSVWDWDRFGRNQFLGEVRLPLSTLNLTDTTEHWYPLQDKDDGGEGSSYHGQLQLSLMFSPSTKHSKSKKTKGSLNVRIRQAKDLPHMPSSGTTDAFVKCYLLPDKSSGGKRKTGVVKNNLNPVWDSTFTYEKLSLEELASERVLEVNVWDFNKGGSSDFIGGLRLGPAPGRATKPKEWMDSIGEEVTHWETALSRPGEWVELCHTLRTNMDFRSVSLT